MIYMSRKDFLNSISRIIALALQLQNDRPAVAQPTNINDDPELLYKNLLSDISNGCLEILPIEAQTRIAEQYIKQYPFENNKKLLTKMILNGGKLTGKTISKAISEDFACNNICVIEGWLISRIEARLYVLKTLFL